jgi:hypothetical protein
MQSIPSSFPESSSSSFSLLDMQDNTQGMDAEIEY